MTKILGIKPKLLILLSIFFVSVSLFVYQVVLTRIYSAILSYHYTFLITSLAICGSGFGNIMVYWQQNRIKVMAKKQLIITLDYIALILAFIYIVILFTIYSLPFMNSVLIYVLLGTFPFIIGGYYISRLFSVYPGISNKLYFADMIGSGIGSVAVIFLLNNLGMLRTTLVISIFALMAAFCFTLFRNNIKLIIISTTAIVLLASGLFLPKQYIDVAGNNLKGLLTNPYKTFGTYKSESEGTEIVYSKWNSFSRTDVIRVPEISDYMMLTIDGAANAPMMYYNGDVNSLEKYKKETEFLPFTMGRNDKTLIIGPGGGRDVLYALAAGSDDISAVEINSSSIEAVKKYSEYNGNIYNLPQVKIYAEDGRNFVRSTRDKFDTIFLSLVMTNASQSVGYALSENYIYTVEAMQDYLSKIKNNGRIAFLAHDQDDLEKLVTTSISALTKRGIPLKETAKYIAIFAKNTPSLEHGGSSNHIHYPIIIVKNVPFSKEESRALLNKSVQNEISPLFLPFIYEEGPIQHLQKEHYTFEQFTAKFNNNVSPSTDDSPYFYNFEKGIPSTLLILLIAVVLGSSFLFIPFIVKNRNLTKPAIYFGSLGIGFMLIETSLIQKFSLYLGHPVTAFSYVLAALLIGSGLGGVASSGRLFDKVFRNMHIPTLVIALINVIIIVFMDFIFLKTSNWSQVNKIILTSVIVTIQGFFMGVPFPRGLRILDESHRHKEIPIMFGINGVMSVLGSVLAIVISMSIGFNGTFLLGGLIYIFISIFKTP